MPHLPGVVVSTRATPDTAEQQAGEFTAALLAVAEQLRPSEGFYVNGIVLARTKGGNLRIGFGDCVYGWFRGDTETLLREDLVARLDWRKCGYYASDLRRDLEVFLENPSAYRCVNVGRSTGFRFLQEPGRRLAGGGRNRTVRRRGDHAFAGIDGLA